MASRLEEWIVKQLVRVISSMLLINHSLCLSFNLLQVLL
jgi:hypothetical protein